MQSSSLGFQTKNATAIEELYRNSSPMLYPKDANNLKNAGQQATVSSPTRNAHIQTATAQVTVSVTEDEHHAYTESPTQEVNSTVK